MEEVSSESTGDDDMKGMEYSATNPITQSAFMQIDLQQFFNDTQLKNLRIAHNIRDYFSSQDNSTYTVIISDKPINASCAEVEYKIRNEQVGNKHVLVFKSAKSDPMQSYPASDTVKDMIEGMINGKMKRKEDDQIDIIRQEIESVFGKSWVVYKGNSSIVTETGQYHIFKMKCGKQRWRVWRLSA